MGFGRVLGEKILVQYCSLSGMRSPALAPEKRTKTIHVITTDTQVENPVVSAWVRKSLQNLKVAAKKHENAN